MKRILNYLTSPSGRRIGSDVAAHHPRNCGPEYRRMPSGGEVMAGLIHLPDIFPKTNNFYH